MSRRFRHLPQLLHPGETGTVTAYCFDGTEVAVGGGYEVLSDAPGDLAGITVGKNKATTPPGDIAANGPTAWTATITNHGPDSHYFNTAALCARAGTATLDVVQRSDVAGVTLAPGASGASTARCRSGEKVTGGGFVAARASDGSIDRAVAVGQSEANGTTNPTAWTAFATNNDTVDVNFSARAMCASAGSTPLHVVERTQRSTLAPGEEGTSTATCRSSEVATGGGFVARRTSDGSIEHAVAIGESEPLAFGANGPIDWNALVTNNDTVTAKFAARVVCVS